MRIIVTGDRHWNAHELVEAVVTRLLARYGMDIVIVHGAATGIDSAFAEACDDLGVEHEPHPADWTMGLKAGPVGNQAMVDAGAGLCVAFHRAISASRGTKDCCRRAIRAGIPTWLIDSERGMPKRLGEGDARLGP